MFIADLLVSSFVTVCNNKVCCLDCSVSCLFVLCCSLSCAIVSIWFVVGVLVVCLTVSALTNDAPC